MSNGAPPASRRGADGARAERAAHVGDRRHAARRRQPAPARRAAGVGTRPARRDRHASRGHGRRPTRPRSRSEFVLPLDADSAASAARRGPAAGHALARAQRARLGARPPRAGRRRRAAAGAVGAGRSRPWRCRPGPRSTVPDDAELVVRVRLQEDLGARARGDERPQRRWRCTSRTRTRRPWRRDRQAGLPRAVPAGTGPSGVRWRRGVRRATRPPHAGAGGLSDRGRRRRHHHDRRDPRRRTATAAARVHAAARMGTALWLEAPIDLPRGRSCRPRDVRAQPAEPVPSTAIAHRPGPAGAASLLNVVPLPSR